jgi:hypothetical protein
MTCKLNVQWWYNFVSFVRNISKPNVKKIIEARERDVRNFEHRQLKASSFVQALYYC